MSQHSLFGDDSPQSVNPFQDWAESFSPLLAQVVFPTGLDGVLDYLIPDSLETSLQPGMRIQVPLGKSNRPLLGYCVGTSVKTVDAEQYRKLKSILHLVDSQRLLSEKMLQLANWIADYYLCPVGTVLEAMLPAGVRGHAATRLTTIFYVDEKVDEKMAQLKSIPSLAQPVGSGKRGSGLITEKQLKVLDVLRNSPEPLSLSEWTRAAKCSQVPIQALKRLGLVRTRSVRRETNPLNDLEVALEPADLKRHTLNVEQQNALERIIQSLKGMKQETLLLHGVTGSGKTEVYMQSIEYVVASGRQAIVLVPEISLTPQTLARFRGRFEQVAVLHSHLTDAERNRQWSRITSGKIQVVVGARSAIFAPVPHLGLIIIDEEHESSFKQDTAPRYHARTVAQKRAEQESVPLLLGSATPSLESWYAAQKGEFQLITLKHRVKGRALPAVSIVDLREAVRSRRTLGAVHQQLHGAIDASVNKQEQVILLLNRRGFSTQIQCPACGEVVKCPECDVSLTHHRTEEIALCHYCDYQIPAPQKCPKCQFAGIRYFGFGTQKLEQEIKSRFPNSSVLRMDTDTMQGRGSHERALSQFREGKVQILLGTQMIAKGLDFPNVTLVGVINADTALHLPDFRASERTFLLITQVAGRTGRGEKGGRVIIQTFNPDHPAILAAVQHDYRRFVGEELPIRRNLGYPPYSRMSRFIVRGLDEKIVLNFAKELGRELKGALEKAPLFAQKNNLPELPKFRLLGPAPAPFAKLRGFFRFHLHLHVYNAEFMRWSIRLATSNLKTPGNVQWTVDIDPLDML